MKSSLSLSACYSSSSYRKYVEGLQPNQMNLELILLINQKTWYLMNQVWKVNRRLRPKPEFGQKSSLNSINLRNVLRTLQEKIQDFHNRWPMADENLQFLEVLFRINEKLRFYISDCQVVLRTNIQKKCESIAKMVFDLESYLKVIQKRLNQIKGGKSKEKCLLRNILILDLDKNLEDQLVSKTQEIKQLSLVVFQGEDRILLKENKNKLSTKVPIRKLQVQKKQNQ